MKTPDDLLMLYDDRCPLCSAYTRFFVRRKLLRPENRVSFSALRNQDWIASIDFGKARNEIPLVDRKTGEVRYGIDALLHILSFRIPRLVWFAGLPPIRWFLKKLYVVISFNRRIIVGHVSSGEKNFRPECDCAPEFHPFYRTVFFLLAEIFAVWISFLFGANIGRALSLETENAGYASVLVCGSGWLLTMLFSLFRWKGRASADYLGNLALLQMTGVVPLIPSLFFSGKEMILVAAAAGVLLSATWMIREHARRTSGFKNKRMIHYGWMTVMATSSMLMLFIYTRC